MRHLLLAAVVFLDVMPGACSCGSRHVPPPPPPPRDEEPMVACTEEAKVCPDGSSVGRTGPHCEFSPCPGEGGALKPVDPPPASGDGRFAEPPPAR